jgi:hypothetical protein
LAGCGREARRGIFWVPSLPVSESEGLRVLKISERDGMVGGGEASGGEGGRGVLPPFSGSFRSVFAPDEVSSQYSKNLPDLATDTYLRDNQATDKDKAD